MMNIGILAQIASGVLLLALIALVIFLGIRWLWPQKAELPMADLAKVANIVAKPLAEDYEVGAAAERPPGDMGIAELACEGFGAVHLETGQAIAKIEMPPLITIHRPVETNRKLEVLQAANKKRSDYARVKAANSRLAVISGALPEETVADNFKYTNVKAMHQAWARYRCV